MKAIVIGVLSLSSFVVPFDPRADASGVPPAAANFLMSSLAVTPGSQVALHWRSKSADGEFSILTSTAPTALPNFDSNAGVTWPTGYGAKWIRTARGWLSMAQEVAVEIPANATSGTIYQLQLYTCSWFTNLCSNSPGGTGGAQVTLTVAANWNMIPYQKAFSDATGIAETGGEPLAIVLSPDKSIWNSSEFSGGIGGVPSASSGSVSFRDPTNVLARPFANCFNRPCNTSGSSALSEQVAMAKGMVWFTKGGWLFDPDNATPNRSEVVSFNPSSHTFCTYVVPGNNNEVIGLAVTGPSSQSRIWFTETNVMTGQPYLDSFYPALVGDGCPGTANESYSLNGFLQRIPWPANNFPAQIAADPSSAAVWVTDAFTSEVDRVDANTGHITPYHWPAPVNSRSVFGAMPWQLVVDNNFVYAIDYGDSNLVRINKMSGQIDEVPIPLTSDTEQGYGVAISGGRLYFTLSDDIQPAFGAASTFGYIDIATWEAASASCSPRGTDCAPAPPAAVVYTGLSVALSESNPDFRGIAVGTDGTVAMADLHQVIRLTR